VTKRHTINIASFYYSDIISLPLKKMHACLKDSTGNKTKADTSFLDMSV